MNLALAWHDTLSRGRVIYSFYAREDTHEILGDVTLEPGDSGMFDIWKCQMKNNVVAFKRSFILAQQWVERQAFSIVAADDMARDPKIERVKGVRHG